jgi:hypothetical protein
LEQRLKRRLYRLTSFPSGNDGKIREDIVDTATMIKALQDPMGIPFYPIVFQILMVLTFALHIFFVNFTIGASALAVYGHFKGDSNWKRLSKGLAKAAPATISGAMLLGVGPLLFIQVLYDPFWYASNMLSAAWVIGFILIMMAAYGFLYVFYLGGTKEAGKGRPVFGVLSVLLFLLAGVIMHVLNYQFLQPEKWLTWYAGQGKIDTSGMSLHTFQLPRFLHFIVPSFALTGILLMLYAWYFRDRTDMDKAYVSWVGQTGIRLAFLLTLIQAIVGLWWVLSVPEDIHFLGNPLFLVGAALGILLLFLLYAAQKDPTVFALPSGLAAFLAVFGMSYAREGLRMAYLARFDYSIFRYPINQDWGSTLLFLVTFVVGVSIIAYILSIAFKTGKASAGVYTASPAIQRWGSVSIGLLLAWLVVVAGLGVVITVNNYLL